MLNICKKNPRWCNIGIKVRGFPNSSINRLILCLPFIHQAFRPALTGTRNTSSFHGGKFDRILLTIYGGPKLNCNTWANWRFWPRKRTFRGPRWPHDVKCRELFHEMRFKQNTRLLWGNCFQLHIEWISQSFFLLANKCWHLYGQHISHGGWRKHTCSTLVKRRKRRHLSKQRQTARKGLESEHAL